MNYNTIEFLNESDFKRLASVQRATFNQTLAVVTKGLRDFEEPLKLSRADQLLMTLIYWQKGAPSLIRFAHQVSNMPVFDDGHVWL
ncbi:MAG TPA: hypothetical protein PLM89_08075 [Anaerolineales bacterium]|nr:hypothetical protein [Anaerolineales bacterium]